MFGLNYEADLMIQFLQKRTFVTKQGCNLLLITKGGLSVPIYQ